VGRLVYLDVFKTLLVYGMVGAHVIMLLGNGLKPWASSYVDFINLISFSGFMLAFGIGTGLQRKDGRKHSFSARVWPALLMLGAVYVSSLGYIVLVEERALTQKLLLDLATMRVLFGFSQFLASFFVLYVAVALARPLFLKLGESAVLIALVSALCLAATLFVSNADFPLWPAIVSTTRFQSYPLIAYLPWFLIGIYLGRRGSVPNLWLFGPAILATGAFVAFIMMQGDLPPRFPPSALWIAGGALPLMVYLFGAQLLGGRAAIPEALLLPGRHALRFVVLSNLAIFGARHFFGRPLHDWPAIAATVLGIILAITLLSLAANAVMAQQAPAKGRRRA
jgi:uncharacterized membrane protein (DUF485 family)